MIDKTHIYNLKAVMHEVGLSAATLRAWESRYGLLKPQRSAGRHRLYSRQDIEMIKWLVQKQKEGLSISHAVEMWKTTLAVRKRDLLQTTTPAMETIQDESMLDEMRDGWIEACKVFDDQAANQILDQAFAIASPETICTQMLQSGLAQIGAGWYAGLVSVQQEHFASAIAIRRINNLLTAAAPPTRAGHILAACPPSEAHDFILLLVTYLLRRAGWNVVYLGADVPLNDLEATIRMTEPVMVISAAQTVISAASLRKMSEYLVTQGTPLAFGGGIFSLVPSCVKCVAGYYLGTDLTKVPKMVEMLVAASPPLTISLPVSPEYHRTLDLFLQNEALLGSQVASQMQAEHILPAHLELGNTHLTRMIASSLTLGDINLLDHSYGWIYGLLENRGLSPSVLSHFYTAYQQAVRHYLGDEGRIILEWLAKIQTQK